MQSRWTRMGRKTFAAFLLTSMSVPSLAYAEDWIFVSAQGPEFFVVDRNSLHLASGALSFSVLYIPKQRVGLPIYEFLYQQQQWVAICSQQSYYISSKKEYGARSNLLREIEFPGPATAPVVGSREASVLTVVCNSSWPDLNSLGTVDSVIEAAVRPSAGPPVIVR